MPSNIRQTASTPPALYNGSRWLTGLAWLPCLLLVPGCGLTSALQPSSDHVYSELSPSDLSRTAMDAAHETDPVSSDSTPLPVRSNPADDGASVSQTGRIRLSDAETAIVDRKLIRVSHQMCEPDLSTCSPYGSFHQAEPRVCEPVPSFNGVPSESVCDCAALVQAYPEEYICDGGDRGEPVRYHGRAMIGLETEDTVVEYNDYAGEHEIRPSNRVCVYAPRFGSVRAVSGPQLDVKVDKAVGAVDVARVGKLHANDQLALEREATPAVGFEARRRADGVEVDQIAQANEQHEAPHLRARIDTGVEGRAYSAPNILHKTDSQVLAQQQQNAVIWTREQFPQIAARTSQAEQVRALFKPQETIGLEDQRKHGPLRIIKLADRATAQSGDVITFTIHYENMSDFEVSEVRIIDNLTPRLVYVEDSAQADRAGATSVEPNGEGSDKVIFDFDEPLPGGATGKIVFSATVR